MRSQVNFVYDLDDDPQDEVKHWLFLENVRLQQERQELTEERQKLAKERESLEKERRSYQSALNVQEKNLLRRKELFEKQWQLMENELRKMSKERAALERDRENIKRLQNQTVPVGDSRFFAGIYSSAGLKKRYRELLKIYHPDNDSGDAATVLVINQEYKSLKKKYGID